MSKYIIEIEEGKEGVMFCQSGIVSIGLHLEDEESLRGLGIKSAMPYDTSEAYQRGYETAKHEYEDCRKVRTDAEQELADKIYQKGLNDAWVAARKIGCYEIDGGYPASQMLDLFDRDDLPKILSDYTALEAIEKIRQYEQEQEEKSLKVEDVMRQYLDTFCTNETGCSVCPLHTPEFTCGRGYSFLTDNPVSDEEVRRAYSTVFAKTKGEPL